MSEPIRVLLVANRPPPLGGMTVWTRSFLETAPRHGIAATLRRVGPRNDAEILRPSSRLGRISRNVILPVVDVVLRKARGCEVVHTCASGSLGIWSGLVLAEASAARGVPVVLHVHSSLSTAPSAAVAWINRLVKNPLVRLVTPSHRDAAGRSEFLLIDNLVSERFSQGPKWMGVSPGKTLRLLFLGWLVEVKGLFELVEALSEVEGVTVDLVGPDVVAKDSARLRQRIRALGLQSRMIIRPTVPHEEIPAVMASYDALILPSHIESFGMVAAEAMLLGLPVIGTRVGLLWDMPDACFAAIPARDAAGLAQALKDIRDRKHELLPRLAEAAKEHAQATFSADAVVARWRLLYASLAERA